MEPTFPRTITSNYFPRGSYAKIKKEIDKKRQSFFLFFTMKFLFLLFSFSKVCSLRHI